MKRRFRNTLMFALFFSCMLGGAHSVFAGPPEWPTCSTSGLTLNVIGIKFVDGQRYFVRRMATIFDNAMDDYGASVGNDNLEIFCISRTAFDHLGKIAVCLSGENCPWR